MKYLVFILFVISVFITGCKKNNVEPLVADYNYFPLKVGTYQIYQVVEINIDKTVLRFDTVKYELKEIIDSPQVDITNHVVYPVLRYKRADASQPWSISDAWVAGIVDNAAHKVEENQRFVKIKFPAANGKSWNGNGYNNLEELNYKITGIDAPETINAVNLNRVLTVTQQDYENAIEKFYSVEKFAYGIGLVYKEKIEITSVSSYNQLLPIEQRESVAYKYKQTLVSYGNN